MAAELMGGIDLMFYVAGYGVLQPIGETDPDVWTDVYRVNVLGAIWRRQLRWIIWTEMESALYVVKNCG